QIVGLEEDRISKPNRPIVAGRLSVVAAQKLYIVVGLLALAWSMYHGVKLCSAIYFFAIFCYNEGGMSRHWFFKSFLGAIGYVYFPDRPGDAAIALLLPPRLARWTLAFLMAAWTVALICLWAPPRGVSVVLALLCIASVTNFIRDHSVATDRVSYWYYNMWFITAHLLPAFARFEAGRVDPTSLLL
ncbi:hypothetical protein B0H13DRAFT_1602190, partial [Mycena leptocephala]